MNEVYITDNKLTQKKHMNVYSQTLENIETKRIAENVIDLDWIKEDILQDDILNFLVAFPLTFWCNRPCSMDLSEEFGEPSTRQIWTTRVYAQLSALKYKPISGNLVDGVYQMNFLSTFYVFWFHAKRRCMEAQYYH